MKKVILLIIIATSILSTIIYNKNNIKETETGHIGAINKVGNTSGNIANGGIVAQQGDWIYYKNGLHDVFFDRKGGLWRININEKGKQLLTRDEPDYINVVGNWVYYGTSSNSLNVGEAELYKIRTDGTERTKISDDTAANINVIGDWIYYSNWDDNNNLYRMKTDGTHRERILNIYATEVIVSGDYIYFTASIKDDENNIYSVKVNGEGKEKLNNDESWRINPSQLDISSLRLSYS